MSQTLRATLLVCLAAAPALAQTAIDGTLRNGTTGAAGRADRVNLMSLSQGMSQVATLTQVEGSFHFDLQAPGPYLVQAQLDGVSYNVTVPPQERGIATPEVVVYESTTDTSALKVSIPHWIVIVDGPNLHISRVFEITNETAPPRTIVGDRTGGGALRFDLPDAAKVTSATITSARMPLRQEPVETPDGKGKTIAYGLKPGVTRYELEHDLPYPGEITLQETLYHGAQSLTAIVLPASVAVESPDLKPEGTQERQGVSFLTLSGGSFPPGKVLTLKISGQATAPHPPGGEGASDAGAGADAGASAGGGEMQGKFEAVLPAGSRGSLRWLVLVLGSFALLGALAAALGKPAPPAPEVARRRQSARAEELLDALARLEDDLAQGRLDAAAHAERRAATRRELLAELEGSRRKKKSA